MRDRVEKRKKDGFCDVLDDATRFAIVRALASAHRLFLLELRKTLQMTRSRVTFHAKALEKAGYVRIRRVFADRIPRTEFSLTTRGKKALDEYVRSSGRSSRT